MKISTAKFISSVVDNDKLPTDNLPEFAFIGRSNVGKSSLINMLTQQKDMARTSSSPGKTQTINHYLINGNWYLVDLPGYGFAKVSRDLREKWDGMIRSYLGKRVPLACVIVLVDMRHEALASDLEFINQLGESGIPLAIAFTKADKLSVNERNRLLAAYRKKLLEYWEELPTHFVTSAEEKWGRDELLAFIQEGLDNYRMVNN